MEQITLDPRDSSELGPQSPASRFWRVLRWIPLIVMLLTFGILLILFFGQ